VLCLASLFITPLSNSQTVDTSTTGNLINYGTSPTDTTSIWNNGVYVNQLCFGAGQPGNCGPNPSIREGNNINFSYGTVDLNQIVNINRALSISGSTVQLSGFNFGFTAKNGNGWDDGRQDYLSAYVKLYGSTGSQVASYDYTAQTNQRYNWTQFNFSETFATPYTASTLGNAQVGFVGRDNNFWAGTYGPEIYNVSFSLKYSTRPDPCIADPLSSPTCPGYALATVKNSILGSTVSNASVTSFVPTINYALASPGPGLGPAITGTDFTNPAAGPQGPMGSQGPMGPAAGPQGPIGPQGPMGPAAGPQGQDPNQNPSGPQDSPSQPGPQQGPAAGPQPAGGPPQATQTASAPPPSAGPQSAGPQQGGGGGAGPSKLAMSVVRTAQANDRATQAQAVQNAAKAFEATQQSSQTASNAAVSMNQEMSANSATAAAQFSSQTTQTSQQTINQSGQGPQQFQQSTTQQQQTSRAVQTTQQTQSTTQQQTFDSPITSSVALRAPVITTVDAPVQSSSGTGLIVNRNPFAYNPLSTTNTNSASTSSMSSAPAYQPRLQDKNVELEMPQVASFNGVGRAGNPLSEIIMQQRFELLQGNTEQQSGSVNRNVLPNELAGGIDIASIASVPTGFNAYSFVLRDSAFYEPKEVYKNQRTVDNARVLRGLTGGSDALHQRMVDQQYK